MSTTKSHPLAGQDLVIRIFEVVICPDAEEGYEPFTVTLRYSVEQAEALERDCEKSHGEAFKRAVKVERNTRPTADDTVFSPGPIRWVGEKFIPAAQNTLR